MTKHSRPFGQIFEDLAQNFGGQKTTVDTAPSVATGIGQTHPSADETMPKMLNIGCGYDKRPGYLNIDMDPACEPDVLVGPDAVTTLPSGYFEKVLAKDVLEHIPRTETLSALLQWSQYLKLGGRLELQTSSIYGIVDMMRRNETFEYHYGMTVCMFGTQVHPGDFHYTGFTEQTLRVQLLAAGFMPISITLEDGWLFHVRAIKFEDWTKEPDEADKIDALFCKALGHPPESHHVSFYANTPYIDAARAVYSSPERLYQTAIKFGI